MSGQVDIGGAWKQINGVYVNIGGAWKPASSMKCNVGGIWKDAWPGGIDSYTKLMLHLNGVNGSTTFTDSALSPKTVTGYGNAQISTAQSKFGGASGLFDGAGDYLSVPDSADWAFGSGDFTIDFWMRANSFNPAPVLFAQGNAVAGLDTSPVLLQTTTAGKLQLYATSVTNAWDICAGTQGTHALVTGTWYHVAVVRNGNTWTVYVNGEVDITFTSALTPYDCNKVFTIGATQLSSGFTAFYSGWIDEFRISKGIARWTANFTPPITEYTT